MEDKKKNNNNEIEIEFAVLLFNCLFSYGDKKFLLGFVLVSVCTGGGKYFGKLIVYYEGIGQNWTYIFTKFGVAYSNLPIINLPKYLF